MTATVDSDAGPVLFARYAFPPHELGYCGPTDVDTELELGQRAREFDGAWPYLAALAKAGGFENPLDARIVEAYWIGGELLDRVDPGALLDHLRPVFAHQNPGALLDIESAVAHHSFHVLAVYPWVRLLSVDPVTPLAILQKCRIRWGTVVAVDEDHATVESRPLEFDGTTLTLGEPSPERIRWRNPSHSLIGPPRVGLSVSAHWGWICDRLDSAEVSALAAATERSLALVNAVLIQRRS